MSEPARSFQRRIAVPLRLCMSSATPLSQYLLRTYAHDRLGISPSALQQYAVSVSLFSQFLARPARLSDFTDRKVTDYMHWLMPGREARTVNDKRNSLLTIWRHAVQLGHIEAGPRRVPRLKEPHREPTAWTIHEVGRLLNACREARTIQHWDGAHWQALILTCFDTAHRIGALLQVEREQLSEDGWLLVLAKQTKHKRDTRHKLHPDTLTALRSTSPGVLLFPWPLARRQIFVHLRKLLAAAGLPNTRRDLFHKLRKTSYSYAYAELGPQAASEHAAHSKDLSRVYLDVRFLHRPSVAESIPRPVPTAENS